MRYFYHTLAGVGIAWSSQAVALDIYADVLYWRPSESVDWALTNSNISAAVSSYQEIAYKTIDFKFAPGFRIGAGFNKEDWLTRILYTRLHTTAHDSTEGNVVSTFMPSKFSNKFYGSAQVAFAIDMDMADVSVAKLVRLDDAFTMKPSAGLRAGSINQTVNTRYQNSINMPPATFDPRNVLEYVTNNFTGVGPLLGLDTRWNFYQKHELTWGVIADVIASYQWGRWSINDTLYANDGSVIGGLTVGKRDFGAFAAQGFFGIGLDCKQYHLKAGYEVSDWFNQYQVFDNGSGTHTNDLVFQGLTVGLQYRC